MEITIQMATGQQPDLDAIGKQQRAEREAYENYSSTLLAYLAVQSATANNEDLQSGDVVLPSKP